MEAYGISCTYYSVVYHFCSDTVLKKPSIPCLEICVNFCVISRTNSIQTPKTLQETLKACSPSLYSNIHTILRLLLITPVTSATVERRNSSLRYVSEECLPQRYERRTLIALLLLFIHKTYPWIMMDLLTTLLDLTREG